MARSQWLCAALGVVAVVLYLALAPQVAHDRPGTISDFDQRVSTDMTEFRHELPALRIPLFAVTQLARMETMFVLVPLGAFLLWTAKQRNAALIFLACGCLVGAANGLLKDVHARERPSRKDFRDPWVHENNMSFPSGHASASLAIYGLLAFLAWRRAATRKAQLWILVGFGLLIVTIGFSRIYLCAHWTSDVIGGYFLGLFWLALAISAAVALGERPAPT